MKLAEALLLRADIQKKLAALRERIKQNTVVQEGEKPSEDPNELIDQVRNIADELQKLVLKINKANLNSKTEKGRTLTEALSLRETLILKHSIIQTTANSAAKPPDRYGVKEIRWVKTVEVSKLQKEADDFAKLIREINGEIQAANWQIEV